MAVKVVIVLAYLILAPLIGGLLDGLDRIISARMQRRKGPSILQPFYDLGKLFSKQLIAVNNVQLLLNLSYLVILMIAGAMLFSGADLLMVLFILSTADMFLIMAASSDSSPYANMGASREMMQMMAYEPLTLLVAVGFYLTTGSFHVGDIIQQPVSAVLWMPGLLVGFMFPCSSCSIFILMNDCMIVFHSLKWLMSISSSFQYSLSWISGMAKRIRSRKPLLLLLPLNVSISISG